MDTSTWIGSAYTPSGASNTMWWPWYSHYVAQIDRELAAASRHFGMNTLRVFLHPKVYEANASGLLHTVDLFLAQASSHGFVSGLVLFDSCWNTDGSNVSQECLPRKGVHNGCWYEGPEEKDKTTLERFRPYTEDVVRRFGSDLRVRWIEVYNEPRGPNEQFVFALRDAAYNWAEALKPTVPIISCWDDSNDTQILDHHEYDTNFKSGWTPSLYANPLKGSVITEGGSRWYQPPFTGDYGSPLTSVNYLQALRALSANGTLPFVPGAILNWELMVGNSNTRWHWGSPPNSNEPAIPWDGWMFPDGTPVSYTEAASLRRYTTGVDDFLAFEKFLTVPPTVEDGDAYLSVPPGASHTVESPVLGDGVVYETTLWLLPDGIAALVLFADPPLPVHRPTAASVRRAEQLLQGDSTHYRTLGKGRHGQPPWRAESQQPHVGDECTFSSLLNDTDVCSGGPVGYRDLSVAASQDPLAACAQACCDWDECTAWVVRQFSGNDHNCTNTLCCWLKPDCDPSQSSHFSGATAAFRTQPPGPPLPTLNKGYSVQLNATDRTLQVLRVEGGVSKVLGLFPLTSLENGLVLEAWNLLRVVAAENESRNILTLSVYFNPMFPETGFVGNSSDAFRIPVRLAPRLAVQDPSPLAPGSILVLAGGKEARMDYISALPLSVL